MATMPQRREVRHETSVKCPVCEEDVPVYALVDVIEGKTRNSGSAGFRQPVITVSLETKIVGFKIHHECTYKDPYNE